MSERGSFITEWIYCEKCRAATRSVLVEAAEFGILMMDDQSADPLQPYFSGKAGGTGQTEAFLATEDLAWDLSPYLCHPIWIAVLSDSLGPRIYRIKPRSGEGDDSRQPPFDFFVPGG